VTLRMRIPKDSLSISVNRRAPQSEQNERFTFTPGIYRRPVASGRADSAPSAAAEHRADNRELSALMRGAQHGDRAAYTRLVREIMPLLQRVLRARLRFLQAADQDDLMQEVLLSLHRGMTYDPQREFVPWLMAIARNKMADRARRFARSIANEVLVDDFAEMGAAEQHACHADRDGDPEALRQAISRFSAGQRKAIELLKIRELSSREAAEVTGTTPGALRVSVHRAIKTLRISFSNDTAASSLVALVG
jgi:RNA polymerase sigma factor (sigma-70 family)